jgi:hypothetical protein
MTGPCPIFEPETILRAMHMAFEEACDTLQLTHRRARSEVLVANIVASGFGPFAEISLLVCFGTVPLWIRLASGSEAPRRPSGPFKVPSPNR